MSFFPTGDHVPLILQPGEGRVLNVPGGQLSTLKVRGEDTGGAYTVLQVASPPAGGHSCTAIIVKMKPSTSERGNMRCSVVRTRSERPLGPSSLRPATSRMPSAMSV